MVRYALREHRSVSQQFTGFLQGALEKQEETNRSFAATLEVLNESVKDNTHLLGRVLERVGTNAAHVPPLSR